MTWLAFPLTAFLSLQAVDAPVAPSAQDHDDAAIVVARGYPDFEGARSGAGRPVAGRQRVSRPDSRSVVPDFQDGPSD
jgi:hypothetical protein